MFWRAYFYWFIKNFLKFDKNIIINCMLWCCTEKTSTPRRGAHHGNEDWFLISRLFHWTKLYIFSEWTLRSYIGIWISLTLARTVFFSINANVNIILFFMLALNVLNHFSCWIDFCFVLFTIIKLGERVVPNKFFVGC